jgi:cell division protein FtsB
MLGVTPTSWFGHIVNLLHRSWNASVAAMGTSNLAIVVGLAVCLPAGYNLIRYRRLSTMLKQWRRGVLSTTALVILAWLLVVSYHLENTIYEDHQNLVVARNSLRATNGKLASENVELLQSLAQARSEVNKRSAKLAGPVPPIVQHNTMALGPNSVAIESAHNPVFNTFGKADPPPRRLTVSLKEQMVSLLTPETSKISISAVLNNKEAWEFAAEFYEVFTAAHWTVDENRVKSIMIGGRPWTGVQLQVCVPAVTAGEQVTITGPSARLGSLLQSVFKSLDLEFQPTAIKDGKQGDLSLLVGSQN